MISRLAAGLVAVAAVPAAFAAGPTLDQQFAQTVQPFVTQYCIACHSGKTPAAQFDLKAYTSVETVAQDFPHWARVLDKLSAQQMPPKMMPQPPEASRQQVIDWIRAMRAAEAERNAGDPGVVLTRRLSNAEYNYTIRDLTGVDMQPTREFPVDPANPAGFDNSGESLATSPALLKKYLQAARDVADHMVLKLDGFDFATHPMLVETDRDRYAIQRIVDFYKRQPTDYADYFEAAWRYKYRRALGKPRATLASTAADAKVSAKYLALVWPLLEEKPKAAQQEVGPIARLQSMWRALPPPQGTANTKEPQAKDPAQLRELCVSMRDFVVRIRTHTAMQFAAPVVAGLSPWSQPLINWKLREFASHRRNFDPNTLRMASDPPIVLPKIPDYPDLGEEAAPRAAALALTARAGDQDLIVPDGERERYEESFARFSSVFPDAFYISERGRFYPDDSEDKGRLLSAGFHNVMGYFRDDTPLMELILDDEGNRELNRLWDEFDFIADYTKRTWVQYFFNQSGEVEGNGRESGSERPSDKAVSATAVIFGLRDAYLAKAKEDPTNDPVAAEAIRDHFQRVNDTIRSVERMRAEAEPSQLDALLKFAERAYRRPLTKAERDDILGYYHTLRDKNELTHEEAIRNSIVGILMSPDFSFRLDLVDEPALRSSSGAAGQPSASAGTGKAVVRNVSTDGKVAGAAKGHSVVGVPLSDYALASRLSYFLWSSMPDQELLDHAAAGDLHRPEVIIAEARRMLKDKRSLGLATEFGGNWLDFRRFEQHNAVDRERFPMFDNELREAMFQEPIRLIEDMIQSNRPVLDLIYGDYTFVNPVLARHYGMPEVSGGEDHWVRVDQASRYERGGLLPMSVFLTQSSPGLRTSPVKRGNWLVKRVLGEVIPPPPPVVPELPSDESKSDLPLRDMLAKHRSNPVCAACHARFDSFGLAFEGYGPVGEARQVDLAGRPVDTSAVFPGGSQGSGVEGVIHYIQQHREKDYLENLSRKLLAYGLSRSLSLSDELTVEQMQTKLAANGYRFDTLVESVVTSPQFLNRRNPDLTANPEDQPVRGE